LHRTEHHAPDNDAASRRGLLTEPDEAAGQLLAAKGSREAGTFACSIILSGFGGSSRGIERKVSNVVD
jgi:hypothetical protein